MQEEGREQGKCNINSIPISLQSSINKDSFPNVMSQIAYR